MGIYRRKKEILMSSPQSIREKLFSLYHNENFKTQLYLRMRWMLTPFEEVEKYVPKQGLILDLGSGYGIFSNLLSILSDKRNIIGIERSKSRMKIAQNTVKDRSNIKFIAQDLKDVDIPFCDVIICYDVLHHMNYNIQEDLLYQIINKINKGGILIIKDNDTKPYWKYVVNYIHELIVMYLLRVESDKLSFRNADDFKSLLEKIGFKVDIVRLKSWLPYPFILYICNKR